MLSRMRDTVYTRSPRGFSLRKSKVLSVGGSNLKWSKSIERRSKKANEVSLALKCNLELLLNGSVVFKSSRSVIITEVETITLLI